MKRRNLAYLFVFLFMVISLSGCGKKEKDINNVNNDNYISAKLNEKIILEDIAEINFSDVGYTEEILPPNTSGSIYKYEDKAEEKYVLLKGTYKNLLTKKFSEYENFNGVLKINNKYDYKTVIIVFANNDDNNFWERPDSLQTMNLYIWVTVPDDIISDVNNSYDFYLDFIDEQKEITKSVKLNFEMKSLNNNSGNNNVSNSLEEVIGINEEKANNIRKALKDVGIENINAIGKREDKYNSNGNEYMVAYKGNDLNDVYKTIVLNYDKSNDAIVIYTPYSCTLYLAGNIWNSIKDCEDKINDN